MRREGTCAFAEVWREAREGLGDVLARVASRKVREDDVAVLEEVVARDDFVEVDVAHFARFGHADTLVEEAGFDDECVDVGEFGGMFEGFDASVAAEGEEWEVVRFVDGDALCAEASEFGAGKVLEFGAQAASAFPNGVALAGYTMESGERAYEAATWKREVFARL